MQAVKTVLPVYFLIKDDWATFDYRIKPPWHVEIVIMMVNNADDVFKLCISTKGKQKLYNL